MYRIVETEDYYPLSVLGYESGLEVKPSKEAPKETIKMWRCEDEKTGELLAEATIEFKNDCYVFETLSVKEGLRKAGLGKALHDTAIEEFKKLGAKEVWGCAKVPEYYKQYGWIEMDRETSPNVSNCQNCEQFNVSCFPSIIKKLL